MIRASLILALFAGCSSPSKADPAPAAMPAPKNLVCERIKLVDEKAKCEPELTDAGEMHAHRARIDQGKGIVACSITAAMVTMACGPLVPVAAPAESAPETAEASPAVKRSTTATKTEPKKK